MAEQQRDQIPCLEKRTAPAEIGEPQRRLVQSIYAAVMDTLLAMPRIDEPKNIPLSSQGQIPSHSIHSRETQLISRRSSGLSGPFFAAKKGHSAATA